jgi:hypothetical protein
MRTIEEWQKLIQEQEESGLKQLDFCLSKGISFKSFSARKSKIKSAAKMMDKPEKAKFIKVQKIKSKQSVEINSPASLRIKTRTGIEIEFPVTALKSVITILNGEVR